MKTLIYKIKHFLKNHKKINLIFRITRVVLRILSYAISLLFVLGLLLSCTNQDHNNKVLPKVYDNEITVSSIQPKGLKDYGDYCVLSPSEWCNEWDFQNLKTAIYNSGDPDELAVPQHFSILYYWSYLQVTKRTDVNAELTQHNTYATFYRDSAFDVIYILMYNYNNNTSLYDYWAFNINHYIPTNTYFYTAIKQSSSVIPVNYSVDNFANRNLYIDDLIIKVYKNDPWNADHLSNDFYNYVISRQNVSNEINNAFNQGYEKGIEEIETVRTTASNEGYQQGYAQGLIDAEDGTLSQPFSVIKGAFDALSSFLNIQILPHLTVGTLVFTPMILSLIIVVVKMIRG